MALKLQLCALGKGHIQHNYDPNNKEDLEEMVRIIIENMKKGFVVYEGEKGKDLTKLFDPGTNIRNYKIPTDQEIKDALVQADSFILKEPVKRVVLVPPVQGG